MKRKKITLMKYEKSAETGTFPGELERRLATVLMDSNDAILLHDFEGKILAWNRGAESVYGYSKEEALGMNVLEIIPEDRWAESATLMDRLRRGERLESFETRRLAKGDRFIDVWLTATPVLDDEGIPIGIATTERDISERRQSSFGFSRMGNSTGSEGQRPCMFRRG